MNKNNSSFKIGVAGLGTVGVGVVKVLTDNAELIEKRTGRKIEILSVTAGNKNKDRGIDVSDYDWADSLEDMASDERLDAVIECIGGSEGTVKDFVESALKNGRHVVTANKALLAHHGFMLNKLAEKNNVCLAYDAAIAGGIPIVKQMREGLAANNIHSVYGILNGTCNYILTEMRETGRAFEDVLKDAQEMGYAEADPAFDVDGIDAGHKLALLSAIAFGVEPDFENLKIEGVSKVSAEDISYANGLGYRIKLLGVTKNVSGNIVQDVSPCLVSKKSALGNVEGVFNAVLTEGDFVGQTMITGRGAGEGPTASSVVADIIDLAQGNGLPTFGIASDNVKKAQWSDIGEMDYKAFIHMRVNDETGVLAEITKTLSDDNVSVEELIQHGENEAASIVILTHAAQLNKIKKTVEKLSALSAVIEQPTLYRVENV